MASLVLMADFDDAANEVILVSSLELTSRGRVAFVAALIILIFELLLEIGLGFIQYGGYRVDLYFNKSVSTHFDIIR